LNLSQAVQIITYNLFDKLKPWPVESVPVDQSRCEKGAATAVESLEEIGYFKQPQEKLWTYRFIRDVFERASLSESEMQKMEKVFVKMCRISAHKDVTKDE
jgi:tRNA/rRNA methyltransferase